MSIANEWIVFDTNIWIFGLRNQADQPACYQLLQGLNMLYVKTIRLSLNKRSFHTHQSCMRRCYQFIPPSR